MSTPSRPKQLLPLAGEDPLILDTLKRARSLVPDERIRILTGQHLLEPFQGVLGEVGTDLFQVEPQARGTGPVLVWAAWSIAQSDPDAVIVSLHADHAIDPVEEFLALIRTGAKAANATDALFTVAVPPTRPETGYGYIEPGDPLPAHEDGEAFWVRSFVEKPEEATAREYLDAGYLWNSGIFLWRAHVFLEEVARVAPELAELLPYLEAQDVEGFFRNAPVISVDEAVLERSSRVASLRATFRWDDVGSWEALGRTCLQDRDGNVRLGAVHTLEARDNIVMAEEGTVVLFGVEGLAVVRSGDIVLVTQRARTPELKSLLATLPSHLQNPE